MILQSSQEAASSTMDVEKQQLIKDNEILTVKLVLLKKTNILKLKIYGLSQNPEKNRACLTKLLVSFKSDTNLFLA